MLNFSTSLIRKTLLFFFQRDYNIFDESCLTFVIATYISLNLPHLVKRVKLFINDVNRDFSQFSKIIHPFRVLQNI